MEFNISAQEFNKTLASVQSTIGKRTTMPILSFVNLEAADDEIIVTATDLEQTIIARSKAEVVKKGAVAISAKTLFDIIRNLPSLSVNVSTNDKFQIIIKCGTGVYRLLGISNEEFPEISKESNIKYASVDNKILAEMLRQVLYTVSADESKMHLRGVLFEIEKNDKVNLVSTDGHRLGICINTVKGIGKTGVKEGVVVPGKSLRELQKFLDAEGEGKGELGFSNTQLYYNGTNITFIVRLQEKNFPDYRVVIPTENDKKPSVDKTQFNEVLKRVSILSSEMYNRVQLKFDKDRLEVSAVNEDVGEAKEDIPVKYDGEELAIGFNAKYLLDALAAISSDEVIFELSDDASAGMLHGVEDESYRCIIMPMRM
ncbi:MAG: DNA polymerase III subunit beta [Myxococcota bacterium]